MKTNEQLGLILTKLILLNKIDVRFLTDNKSLSLQGIRLIRKHLDRLEKKVRSVNDE